MAVPSKDKDLNLGDKKVQDLVEDLAIKGDEVTGTLKYINSWTEFSKTDNSGNFLPLYFAEAVGKPEGTVKVDIKGSGTTSSGKTVNVDPKDGMVVFHVHNNDNTIEITQEGKETRTLKLTKLVLLKAVNEVIKPSEGTHQTFNKKVSDLQDNIQISVDSKVTGTLKWVENFNGDYDGNFIHLHVEQSNLPSEANIENIKFGFEGKENAPDPRDWNYVQGIDEGRKGQKLRLLYNNKVLYELDISGLTLSPKTIKTKKKIETKK